MERYWIIIGIPERKYNWKLENGKEVEAMTTEFQGRLELARLSTDLESKAHEICKLAGIKCYEIRKAEKECDAYRGKLVHQTHDIRRYWEQQKGTKEDFNSKQKEKVERINSLPTTFTINEKPKVVVRRSEANYKPSYSRKVQCQLSCQLPELGNGMNLWISNFRTSDGKLLYKKFWKWLPPEIGRTMSTDNVKNLLKHLVNEYDKIVGLIES